MIWMSRYAYCFAWEFFSFVIWTVFPRTRPSTKRSNSQRSTDEARPDWLTLFYEK